MKIRLLAAGNAIAACMWTTTAAAQSVTTAPFGTPAPAINVAALFALAVLLTGSAWYCLRRKQAASRAPGIVLTALALASWTVAVKAVDTEIQITAGDCLIETTNAFNPNTLTFLKSDCTNTISVVALDDPCSENMAPCIDRPRCDVGLLLNDGESCDLPYCPPTCVDAMKNGNEADVDCGGSECDDCALGKTCGSNSDCQTGSCAMGLCKCPSRLYTFGVSSNSGGVFDSAEWPGGTQTDSDVAGCSVTINNPNDNIDLACTLAGPFSVNSFAGYATCTGSGGEDGDGCNPVSCPPAGLGSCCSTRPSCSSALNGSGQAQYSVQCNP